MEDIASELLELKYVMKFGNASLADPQAISRAARIVAEYQMKGHKLVVVVSALPKVTDELVSISEKAVEGNIEMINEFVERQTKRHISIAKECIRDQDILRRVVDELEEISLEMRGILTSIARLRELTPRSKDFVLSFGERLAAPIVCGATAESGLKSEWLTGNDAGITTDDNFGEANPLMDITVRKVKAKLEPMLNEGKLPIVTGYGAANPHGVTTTLGRGGSDYTATLIGAALDADEVMIWKDVEGLMTADPKIEPNAKLLPRISYAEASEMAYFGAKAIHPRAMQPVMDKEIPVRIRSSFDPTNRGHIGRRRSKSEDRRHRQSGHFGQQCCDDQCLRSRNGWTTGRRSEGVQSSWRRGNQYSNDLPGLLRGRNLLRSSEGEAAASQEHLGARAYWIRVHKEPAIRGRRVHSCRSRRRNEGNPGRGS